jgi:hypothetical protein
MAQRANKTQVTAQPVAAFLDGITPASRRDDAIALCAIMERVSGETPRMWGPAIVGFGQRHYRYDSGREGEICKIGFSPRKQALVLYLSASAEADPLVSRLGKVTTGKSCIYVKRLADIDLAGLETLVGRAWKRKEDVLS